jgi:hypothetical protein
MSPAGPLKDQDVALVYAPTEDRKGARILRARKGTLEAGEVRPVKAGQPIWGREVVCLKPRSETSETPVLCDVEVIHPAEPSVGEQKGPAQIATDAYRSNWERIFGALRSRSTPPGAPN